ncbi:MAG: hypothetical protein K2X66_00710 [Cyanobacteria bacterium]|nr:hypothetical protein [Cyanobacteriota bacterium]
MNFKPPSFLIPPTSRGTQQSVLFGWNNSPEAAPRKEQYTVQLSNSDFQQPVDLENPQPSKMLLDRVVHDLRGLENNRFIVLEGTLALLQKNTRVHRFQENVMKGLYQTLRATDPSACPGARYNLMCQLIKGYGPTTQMHWDFKEWPFLSISYQQSPALQSSGPLIADSGQLFKDIQTASSAEDKKFWDDTPESSNKPDVILHQFKDRMTSKYLIALPLETHQDIPILIFNNHRNNGVLHGASRPQGEAFKDFPFQDHRTIYQIAISDEAFPDHKYTKLKFQWHQKLPLEG